MTSTNPSAGAGKSAAGVQLDTELVALLQLTDQLGHHVEHRAATRLLAHMDAAAIAYLDTGTSRAVPTGHETDTGLITLVAMMHVFINGAPITAHHITIDPAAPWPASVWEHHVTGALAQASPAARSALTTAYASTPGARYLTDPQEPAKAHHH